MMDIKAIREQSENGYPVADCVIPLCDEIERLRNLLRTADIKLAQIETKDMQHNPDDYAMQY